VGTVSSGSHTVARRYAAAFLDMAAQAKLVEKVERDMQALAVMVGESADLRLLARNPLISNKKKKKGLFALAEKAGFDGLTVNFLGVLADNRRLPALEDIIRAFDAELKKRRGIVDAVVESAYALSPAQTKALQDKLAATMGRNVTLDVTVNKDLLGGMVITVGSQMIDDSVRRKLERLQRTMSGQVDRNIQLKEVG